MEYGIVNINGRASVINLWLDAGEAQLLIERFKDSTDRLDRLFVAHLQAGLRDIHSANAVKPQSVSENREERQHTILEKILHHAKL